ncbi:MAG: ferritin-like domain-containing protein [bacterium]
MKKNMCFSLGVCIMLTLCSCTLGKKQNDTPDQSKDAVMMTRESLEKAGINVEELLKTLRTAFADEWMASYQYWMGAKLVQEPTRSDVIKELFEHYEEEMKHANLLANRLLQLGGDLRMFPHEWHKIGGCHYDSITNINVDSVLKENIVGEDCAIKFYEKLLKTVKDKDPVTEKMVVEILNDEIKHKKDLTTLLTALPKS